MSQPCRALTKKKTLCKIKVIPPKTRCTVHDDNIPKCSGKTKTGKECNNKAVKGKDRCNKHPKKEEKSDVVAEEIEIEEFDDIGVIEQVKKDSMTRSQTYDKDEEIEDEYTICPLCKKEETWISLESIKFPKYKLSSLGHVLNIETGYNLKGTICPKKYIRVSMTNVGGERKSKGVHTLMGIMFFGLPVLYDDDSYRFTIDHTNGKRKHNFSCCNLRVLSISDQNKNQKRRKDHRGKTVLKIALDGEIVKSFVSIRQAAKHAEFGESVVRNRCISGKILKGYKYRYLTKEDLGPQKWISTIHLYPNYHPPIEVSTKGWILRKNGMLTTGNSDGKYFAIKFMDTDKNKYRYRLVHSIVWEVFNNKHVPKGLEISHINLRGKDNRIENIECVTRSDNIMRAVRAGGISKAIKVRQILHDGRTTEYVCISEATRQTGVSTRQITRVLDNILKMAGTCDCGEGYGWERI